MSNTVIGLMGISAGAFILYFGARGFLKAKSSKGWPSTRGRITISKEIEDDEFQPTTYRADIQYTYTVDDREYEPSNIRIGDMQTKTFIAGIRGVTTDAADAISVLIDSNGQLGTVSSSRRFKEDIRDMGRESERLYSLRPVTFRYEQEFAAGEKPIQFGLIAEEVAEVFPELVVYDDQGRPEAVKYRLLSTLLLNELKRMHDAVERLRAQVTQALAQD